MQRIGLKIKKEISERRLIEAGDEVILGLSGGPDSVFLLSVLKRLEQELAFHLSAVHVNHEIRGAEAERDLRFCEQLCRELSVPFTAVRADVPAYAGQHGLSLEEAGRILRYRALRARASELQKVSGHPVKIAAAHHQDDQAETVLHNLFRGSGLRGLAGMDWERDGIIRPMLSVSRADILEALSEEGLSYVTDSTNQDLSYERNRIRGRILPEARVINQRAAEHIAETAELLREADRVLSDEAEKFLDSHALNQYDKEKQTVTCQILPVPDLFAEPALFRVYVFQTALNRLGTPRKDWSRAHFEALNRLLKKGSGAHLDLPYRVSADIFRKTMILRINPEVLSIQRRRNKS